MRRLFLLRAYGDFVIAVRSSLLSANPKSVKFIASNHLYPLFEAISSVIDTSQLDISFEDFEDDKGEFETIAGFILEIKGNSGPRILLGK